MGANVVWSSRTAISSENLLPALAAPTSLLGFSKPGGEASDRAGKDQCPNHLWFEQRRLSLLGTSRWGTLSQFQYHFAALVSGERTSYAIDVPGYDVTGASVRMREAPNSASPVVMRLKKGDQLTRQGKGDGAWCKVGALGRTGYVSCQFLRETGGGEDAEPLEAAEAAPVVAMAPARAPEPPVAPSRRSSRADEAVGDDEADGDDEDSGASKKTNSGSPDRSGGFFKVEAGVGLGNFDLETTNDEADAGGTFALGGGWSGESGFGVGVTISVTQMSYQSLLLAAAGSDKISSALSLLLVDVGPWYFAEASSDFVFHFHLGIGGSKVTWETDLFKEEDSSLGLVAGAGAALYITESLGLSFDLTWRSYGLAFKRGGTDTGELSTTGLTVGLLYR